MHFILILCVTCLVNKTLQYNTIKPGGLELSRSCLDQDFQSWHWKRAGLDSQENLDTFKILVSTIKKSRSRLRFLDLVSMAICKSSTSWPRSRLIETCPDFCDCLWFLWISWYFSPSRPRKNLIFHNLDWDIYFSCRNPVGQNVTQGKLRKVKVKPSPTTFQRCLKSKISQLMLRNLDNSW